MSYEKYFEFECDCGTVHKGRIIIDGVDAGKDATGAKPGKFVPKSTAGMPKAPPKPVKKGRYYEGFTAWATVTLSNGKKISEGKKMLAFNLNDGSDSALYWKEAPKKAGCGDSGLPR